MGQKAFTYTQSKHIWYGQNQPRYETNICKNVNGLVQVSRKYIQQTILTSKTFYDNHFFPDEFSCKRSCGTTVSNQFA